MRIGIPAETRAGETRVAALALVVQGAFELGERRFGWMARAQIRLLAIGAVYLALAMPTTVDAQTPPKVYRVGYLLTAAPGEADHLTKAFEERLKELGYVEGRNVMFERRSSEGRQERLPGLAADLVKRNVDVIVSGSNPVVAALKSATATIPIVMATSSDPVGSGFVASLSRPGRNITGMNADPTLEIQAKRLQLLKEAVPKAARVALLWNPLPPGGEARRATVENAARTLGLSLQAVEARGRNEFEGAFAAIALGGADAVFVLSDPVSFTAHKQVAELLMKYRLPAIHGRREEAESGSLMAYGASLPDQFRRAAVYVDKILKGAKPGDIPVEQAAKLELVINLKVAKTLGIAIPASLRLQADHLIE